MALFWKQGYEGTGVAQLCAAMGIARQSLYDWVGTKRGLYVAALRRYRMTLIAGMQTHLEADGSPLENLRGCLLAMAAYAKDADCLGCLVTNAESEFGATEPEVTAVTAEAEAFITAQFEAVLERAKDAGEVPATLDTARVAATLAVFRNGLMVAGRAGHSEAGIDATVAVMQRLILAG